MFNYFLRCHLNVHFCNLWYEVSQWEPFSRVEIEDLRSQLNTVRISDSSELERLRRELKEALDKLAEYRERQERLERAIKPQLAKTHQVLKKAKANLMASQEQEQL